jgi:hypothetical protein
MAVFGDQVTSVTNKQYVPVVVDQVLDSNVLAARLLAKTKRWRGERLIIPVVSSKNTNGGSFEDLDSMSTGLESTRKSLTFYVKGYYQSVTISGMQEAVNKTTGQVLDLIKTEMEQASNTMSDDIGVDFYADGTGNSNKDFDGLEVIVDDGTNVANYGGLVRASNTYLNATLSTAIGTLALSDVKSLIRNASASSSRREKPTIGLTNGTVWDIVEALFATPDPNYGTTALPMVTANTRPGSVVRDENLLKGAQGYDALYYRGVPIVDDDNAPAQILQFINEFDTHFYSLRSARLKDVPRLKTEMVESTANDEKSGVRVAPIQWKDFQMPDNQFGLVGQFIMLGNLIGHEPRRSSKGTGITG